MKFYRCSICKTPIEYEGSLPELFPFCSEHCRRVDLGLWLHEGYAIDRELTPDELEDLDSRDKHRRN